MTYRRAFSTLGIPEAKLGDALALAERHGLDAVELRALGGSLGLPAHFKAEFGSPAGLAERLRNERVRVVSLDTSLHLIGGGPEEREAFLEFAPWAEAAGALWLRAFDGRREGGAADAAEGAETLRWWRAERERNGWRADLMIETHDSLLSAESILAFAAAAPAPAILWDAFNTWIRSGEDPARTWEAIRPLVVHVHVKDAVRVPHGQHPFTFALPGTGAFPMAPLREKLAAEFGGCVSLEWERLWHPSLPPLEEALTSAAERGWW